MPSRHVRRLWWIPALLFVIVLGVSTSGCNGQMGVGIGVIVPSGAYGPYPPGIRVGGGPVGY